MITVTLEPDFQRVKIVFSFEEWQAIIGEATDRQCLNLDVVKEIINTGFREYKWRNTQRSKPYRG